MKGKFPVEKMKNLATPFYYYDTDLLRATLAELKKESSKYNYHVHYAVKANANEKILAIIRGKRIWSRLCQWRGDKCCFESWFPGRKDSLCRSGGKLIGRLI